MSSSNVVIVGGGLAGMAAAEALSRKPNGPSITLLESKRKLGGRAGSFDDRESGETIDYCQHAAMGCCTNWIDMLKRCGLQQHVRRYRELTFLHPQHRASRFAPNRWLPAPLHLLGTINQQHYLPRPCRREVKRGLWKLMRTASSELEQEIASEWLRAAGQSDRSIGDFWDVILVSALGEQTDRISMAAARKVLIDGFAIAHGASDVLVPSLPLSELFGNRLASVLLDRGVRLLTEQPVIRIQSDRTVVTASEIHHADEVICAVPWHQIERLLKNCQHQETPAAEWSRFTRFPTSPITGIHLWWDRAITDLDHAVMVGTLSQWLFREPISHGDPSEDNMHRDGNYTQVVISASADLTALSKQALIDKILEEIRHAFPRAREAQLLRHRIVTDRKSVFSVRPDVEAIRPDAATQVPWLHLAGDWTATGWPATMEGAVISGRNAATTIANRLRSYPTSPESPFPKVGEASSDADFVTPPLQAGWLAKLLIR